ncbi:hypothetical protein FXO37_15908 [Capsicum annuum]|nr:hypothetical protein FXO37_15908 [Capsicum annuum]
MWGVTNSNEVMHLFSWHAFQNPVPLEEYVEVAKGIVTYARGLPLALTVLGSSLFGLPIEEWRNTIEKLKRIPDDNIQEKLKISFDALPDDKVKAIFLDTACCLRGMDKDDAVTILDACDLFAEAGIQDLIDRCLLIINLSNKLAMHCIIRDMGREIVRQESPKEGSKRSRLFFEEDVSDVLLGDKAAEAVEVMMVNPTVFKDIQLSTKAFAKMVNLRLLQIDNVHLKGNFEYLPTKLKWLSWKNCLLKYVPCDFHLKTLVALDMSESKFEDLKLLRSLKSLNLNSCKNLMRTPNFTGAPSLKRLSFENCSSLTEVQSSIVDLNKLKELNLLWCIKLEKLPSSISNLKSLDTLILNWCVTLQQLPDDLGNLQSLKKFSAPRTAVTYLLPSFGRLKKLEYMHMGGFGRSFQTLPELPSNIERLNLEGCTSLEELPNLSQLSKLIELELKELVSFMRERMRKFALGLSRDLVLECNATLLKRIWISLGWFCTCSKLKRRRRNKPKWEKGKVRNLAILSKQKAIRIMIGMIGSGNDSGLRVLGAQSQSSGAQSALSYPPSHFCGQVHHRVCDEGRNRCFRCVKLSHMQRDYLSIKVVTRYNKVLISNSSALVPKGVISSIGTARNHLYALTTHQESEAFPDVITGSDAQVPDRT